LGVSQPWQNAGKVEVTREVSDNVANTSEPASPCIGIFLLVSWCTVDNVCTNGSLDDVDGEVQDVHKSDSEDLSSEESVIRSGISTKEFANTSHDLP